jgi:hypothetical protein
MSPDPYLTGAALAPADADGVPAVAGAVPGLLCPAGAAGHQPRGGDWFQAS